MGVAFGGSTGGGGGKVGAGAMACCTGAGLGVAAGGAGERDAGVGGRVEGAGSAVGCNTGAGAATLGCETAPRTSEKRGAFACTHCGPASEADATRVGRDAAGPPPTAISSAWHSSAAGPQRRAAKKKRERNRQPQRRITSSHSCRRESHPAVREIPHNTLQRPLIRLADGAPRSSRFLHRLPTGFHDRVMSRMYAQALDGE